MLQTQNPYSRERIDALTTMLAGMDARGRQAYAAQHRNDPAVVATAVHVNNTVKAAERAKAMQAGGPMPTVVDQNIAAMTPAPAPMMAQTQLPENQGIAQIPAPNMQAMADGGIAGYGDGDDVPRQNGMAQGGMYDFAQRSEPVLRMAGGGMTGYMPGFKNAGAVNAAFEAALEKTLKYEGGYVKDDAGKGESNFGINKSANPDVDVKNLTKEKARELYKKRYWDAIGGDALAAKDPALATVAFDTAVNMGVSKASQLIAQSKGDPSAMLSLRQQHYDNLIKDNPKKFAPYEKGWKDRVADLATSVIPSAQAGELPKPAPAAAPKAQAAAPADTSLAAQIPGQATQAPASTYDQTNSIFGRAADKMGIPLEAQRQIATTLNAPTPLAAFSGAYAAPTKAGSGIAALGEKIADKLGFLKGPAGSMSKADIAALKAETAAAKNEQAGLRALENSQLAIKDAQGAGATLDEQEYLRKMMEANRIKQTTSAADKISDASLIREGEDVATAQRLMKTTEQAQAAGRTDALADRVMPTAQQAPQAAASYDPSNMEPVRFDEFDPRELSKPAEKEVVEAAKEATPAKERKGFNNDDLLTLGLSLLASKSPNFMTALGEAGLATVAGKKEREKMEREEAKLKGSEELQRAQAKYYGAYAGAIERGAKEKNEELQAEKAITDYMANWDKSMANKTASMSDSTLRTRAENEYRQRIYAQMGIKPIMGTQAAPAASGGFKFVGVN
jgi:lysozyme family protein